MSETLRWTWPMSTRGSMGTGEAYSPLRVLQRRLLVLRLLERERAAADLRVQLVLDPVDLRGAGVGLRPEVAGVVRIAADLEADQMVFLVRRRRPAQPVRAHLLLLQLVRVLDRRTDRLGPAGAADRRADVPLRHPRVRHSGHAGQHCHRCRMPADREEDGGDGRKDGGRREQSRCHSRQRYGSRARAARRSCGRVRTRSAPANAHTMYATHGSPTTSVWIDSARTAAKTAVIRTAPARQSPTRIASDHAIQSTIPARPVSAPISV